MDNPRPVLILPFFRLRPGKGALAFWSPDGAVEVHPSPQGTVVMELDANRLYRTVRALSEVEGDDYSSHLRSGESGVIPLVGTSNFVAIFHALFVLIDAHQWDSSALTTIQLDELIYRQVVLLLRSFKLQKNVEPQELSFKHQLIDELCAKLATRLHLPIALKDIEALSGISARGLQYAFQERFGCSPMAWVREQRLLVARDCLLRGQCTVMEVAVSCGFGSSSLFTRYYQTRFGETPSGTLKKLCQR